MTRISDVFGRSRVLLPVIHPAHGRNGAVAAIRIARENGADGVFLIDQGMHERALLELVHEVRTEHPGFWIGLNLLSRAPAEVIAECATIDGIWSDNAGIDERASEQPRAATFAAVRRGWPGLYFGGVAFKYQREVPAADLPKATALAAAYMDVICTSGAGTGYAANPDKVKAMRSGVSSETAIALASGVTAENVGAYLRYVDAYLVGTGIEHELGVLNPAAVRALADTIHA